MQDMARVYLAILFLFVGTAVLSAADEQQEYVEQNFRMIDAFNDPRYSSVTAAKNGFRVFTNPPGQGITETLTVTYRDGLYVAGEKVVMESEHRRVISELQSTRAEVQGMRSDFSSFAQRCESPPYCTPPGGRYLRHNGTTWVCVCEEGWSGETCEEAPSDPFATIETLLPTTATTTTSPALNPLCETGWVHFNSHCYTRVPTMVERSTLAKGQEVCRSLGGNLVSIHSSEEHEFLFTLCGGKASPITKHGWNGDYTHRQCPTLLIGARRNYTNGVPSSDWMWVDGTTWDYNRPIYTLQSAQEMNNVRTQRLAALNDSCLHLWQSKEDGRDYERCFPQQNGVACEWREDACDGEPVTSLLSSSENFAFGWQNLVGDGEDILCKRAI